MSFIEDLPSWPEEDYAAFGPVETKSRSRIQQIVGNFLARNWVRIPHVTHHDEIDVTELEVRRATWNSSHPEAKISPVIPIVKALAMALVQHPQFATSLDGTGTNLVEKAYAHIGVAVEVPTGLLVPVLRDCDRKPLSVLALELAALAERARTKGLSLAEMAGGCITLSSLGHIGGTGFTPIVNAPQVAILGITRLQDRPRRGPDGESFDWRKTLPASLSYDHRVINGADAARFLRTVASVLDAMEFD